MTMNPAKRKAKPWLVLLYFAGLVLLLSLGFWQFQRGLEKVDLESSMTDAGVVSLNSPGIDWNTLNYAQVTVSGVLDLSRSFLLDNRIHKGAGGYEVLSPLATVDREQVILVNRGWVPKNDVPNLNGIEGVELTGQLYLPKLGFTLGPAYTESEAWPRIIQYLDLAAMSQALGQPVSPVVIVLDSGPDQGYTRIWQPYVMDPMKHYGYAAQWWGLAIVFIVFGLIWRRMAGRSNASQ